jgi:Icc-related predicted phosphoesterase
MADQHGFLPAIPECDLLLIGGDICPFDGPHDAEAQRAWLDSTFRAWLDAIPAEHIIGIAGNHDFVFEADRHPTDLPWHYLQDETLEVDGCVIHGTPWQPEFFDWAFNLATEEAMAEKWALIPDTTDILLVHGPPAGLGDRTSRGERVGSTSLRDRITEIRPRLVVSGHIHEDYGVRELGDTVVVNASLVDELYELAHPLVELTL